MDRIQREQRRDTFLDQAEDYFAARPAYPTGLLELAAGFASLGPGDPVLEIGCGTGEASEWFARNGVSLLAIDRSADMITIARRRLAPYPNVELRCQDFERTTELGEFKTLVSATSYHWLNPDTRRERCAQVLAPGGALVLLWHTHPLPYTGYFERSQGIYESVIPGWQPPPTPGASEAKLQAVARELQVSTHFVEVERRAKDWTRTYDIDLYMRLLNTYSDHRSLDAATRDQLFLRLKDLINGEFGGVVERPYRTEMILARRAP